MMTFKELKKLVKLPLYKEQRVPTVKALEESGVSVVAEKILENHGSISVYQNGYVIYRAHKRVTVFSLRNCVHYKYDALEGAGHHIEEEEFEEYEWHIRLVLEGEDRIFMNYEIIQGKWMPSREDREYREEILEGVDEAVSTLERMISEERVEELLSTLTDLQRKVVHTHLFHGLSFTEEVMEEVLAEHGHSVSECGVISAEYLQEQSYRAETQRAEAMKEKLAAEKPAPEASISFYVAECAEFPVMGEFHDNLTLEQALEVYDKIPAERMNGIKSIGFSLEDGSIYSGMFDLMVGGEVQAEVVNHIQHYRESPLVQKAISDMKTLLEKRQASKELEERPNIRQSVREALKNRKKAQEQQPNQEQVKPKKAKKKGEMEL